MSPIARNQFINVVFDNRVIRTTRHCDLDNIGHLKWLLLWHAKLQLGHLYFYSLVRMYFFLSLLILLLPIVLKTVVMLCQKPSDCSMFKKVTMHMWDMFNLITRNLNAVASKYLYPVRMCTSESFYEPCKTIFSGKKNINYGVVILNCPIEFKSHPKIVMDLWTDATVRVTVDGGTDRWLSWLKFNNYAIEDVPKPDLITGDLDSVCKETVAYFHAKNVTIIKTPDQNRTDFTKALCELDNFCRGKDLKIDEVYVLADTCGRLDQIIGNLHTLYLAKDILAPCIIYQVASNSVSWLLNPGKHHINVPAPLRNFKDWCALIPIANDCRVSTTGLEWNLDKSMLKFGEFISTSNTYNGDSTVTVETDQPIIWSMGISKLL